MIGRMLRSRNTRKLMRNRLAMVSLLVILLYSTIGGLVAFTDFCSQYNDEVSADAEAYGQPSSDDWRLWLGTDRQKRSILVRALYSIKIALAVGLVTALVSVVVGTILGAMAGYFGGWVDSLVVWLFSTVQSIPSLLLLLGLSYAARTVFGSGLTAVYIAFCSTFWVGPCRVIRGEAMKIRSMEYIEAAEAIGLPRLLILIRHVIPNTLHLSFINFSLLFIGAIKSEVILSFLGLGVVGQPSWGIMIDAARNQLNKSYWELGAATAFMFVLVLAFNVFTDGLQDAFDPKAQ